MFRKHGIAAVPHGFRSSFRDWAAEETDHPREVIEAALVHVVQNRVEAAERFGRCEEFVNAEVRKSGEVGHREDFALLRIDPELMDINTVVFVRMLPSTEADPGH